jgi:VRR-NUC domain.
MNDIEQFVEYLREKKPKRKPKAPYRKPDSVKELEQLYFEQKRMRNPDMPFPVKTKFRDDSANGLTRCITAWLQLHGYFAGRVNTTGTYNQKLGRYIYSGSKRGMADVTAVINGRHVSIEIKYGKDRIRPEQLKVKKEIEAAGGVYIIASSFDGFVEKIKRL